MVTGKNMFYYYSVESKMNIEALSQNIKDIQPTKRFDTLKIKFENNSITMNEIFDSGIRRKYKPKMIFNKSITTIVKRNEMFAIVIEIERPYYNRVNTNYIIITLFGLGLLLVKNKYFSYLKEPDIKNSTLYIIGILSLLLLRLFYYISLKKPKELLRLIEKEVKIKTSTKKKVCQNLLQIC
jgi:hypothetical protein